jgi:hypothetical protein
MFTQDVSANRWKFWSSIEAQQLRKRSPLLVNLAILVLVTMTILVLGVVTSARTQPIPQLLDLDLPQAYLPGNAMPEGVLCYSYLPYVMDISNCWVNFRGHEVSLKFDDDMKTILRVTIQTWGLTIGELVAAWGTPTGIVQTYYMTSVHWDTRTAYVYSDSFYPDSQVRRVDYDLESPRASLWHGFRRYRN